MSITRDILEGVRSSLNTVMERIAADGMPLSHVDEAALQKELQRRLAARQSGGTAGPMDNARARLASASPEARQRRHELAEQRAARVRARRADKARAAQAAQEEAFRRAKEQAARSGSSRSSTSGGPRSSGGYQQRAAGGGGSPFQRKDDKIAEYYKVLDLQYGASFDEVKASYRSLMRKYHPDRHMGDPKKQKAATELSMRVTQAYNAIEEHLKKK